jgi:hypothetical protein
MSHKRDIYPNENEYMANSMWPLKNKLYTHEKNIEIFTIKCECDRVGQL